MPFPPIIPLGILVAAVSHKQHFGTLYALSASIPAMAPESSYPSQWLLSPEALVMCSKLLSGRLLQTGLQKAEIAELQDFSQVTAIAAL